MDPASLSVAVVGLFITCTEGYHFLSDVYNAPKDIQDAARKIRIQANILAVWGEHFGIREEKKGGHSEISAEKKEEHEKLQLFLTKGKTFNGVHDVLSAISETFTDLKAMQERYGFILTYDKSKGTEPHQTPSPQAIQAMIEEGESRDSLSAHMGLKEMINCKLKRYRTRISFLKSCRWSLRGKGQVDNLVCILREYNDSLYRLCSWEAQWQINRGLSSYTLRQNNDSVDLHLIADVVDKEAVDGNSPTVEGCRGLGKMARFKAEVITRRPENRWQLLDREVYDLPIGPGFWARPSDTREGEEVMREWQNLGSWTLARDTREGGAVFVEWQSYWDDGVRGGHEAQEQIHELGNFLCVPNRPISFRTLTCIGLFDDFRRRRYGVVFQLPNNLEELDLNDGKLDDFKPTSLKGLIRCANGIDEAHALGARFELARKLVNTVVVLHTCGWLHKNICPDNVLFFSTPPLAGHRLPPWETDITDPFIVGYGLSRKDDILEKHDREQLSRANLQRKLPMSRTKTEGLPKGDCVPSNPRIYNLVLTSIHDADENTEGNPVLNIYQHPDKVANPDSRFRHSYDVYSLGVVLLEIGLWRSLEDIDLTQAKDNHQLRRFILGNLVPKLRSRCGTIYCDVVRDCLKMRTNDNELVDEGQRRLAQSIADRLDSCVV